MKKTTDQSGENVHLVFEAGFVERPTSEGIFLTVCRPVWKTDVEESVPSSSMEIWKNLIELDLVF